MQKHFLCSLAFLLSVHAINANAFARKMDRSYSYDEDRALCVDRRGNQGKYDDFLGECGAYSGQTPVIFLNMNISSALRGLSLSNTNLDGLNIYNAQLSGANIAQVSLKMAQLSNAMINQATIAHTDLSQSNLSGTILKGTKFISSNLTLASLSASDLRGATFNQAIVDKTNFDTAIFDETTSLPFTCKEALARGMIYAGKDEFYCETPEPTSMLLSNQYQLAHPNIYATVRGDQSEIYLYNREELTITPAKPTDLTLDDQNQILCSAMMSACLKNSRKISSRYELKNLPAPVLTTGIEFYHEPIIDIENEGHARLIAFFDITQNLDVLAQMDSTKDALIADTLVEWQKTNPPLASGKTPKVIFRSILKDTADIQMLPNWLNIADPNLHHDCNIQNNTIAEPFVRCELRVDYYPSNFATSGWAEQWMNDLIRKAQLETTTLNLKLVPSVKQAFQGNFSATIPIKNINLTSVTKIFYERK